MPSVLVDRLLDPIEEVLHSRVDAWVVGERTTVAPRALSPSGEFP